MKIRIYYPVLFNRYFKQYQIGKQPRNWGIKWNTYLIDYSNTISKC